MTTHDKDGQMGGGLAPFLVSWNLTGRCNLRCAHCYMDSTGQDGGDEISTAEARGFIDDVATCAPGAMLILTGGEPLLRGDVFELAAYASSKDLTVVVGTNGTLVNPETADALVRSGVRGVGVSIDSSRPAQHDRMRGMDGAWERTVTGMEALRSAGVPFQVQFTVVRANMDDVGGVVRFALEHGAKAVNFFFLVCTGRGEGASELTPAEYKGVLERIAKEQAEHEGSIMVRARCAPQWAVVASGREDPAHLFSGMTSGCIAGRGYLRINHEGFVTPCPYMPPAPGSFNLKKASLRYAIENDPAFKLLRDPVYTGRCGQCRFADACGGCRARGLAASKGLMSEDPLCWHEPEGFRPAPVKARPKWDSAADERLNRVPPFLRGMVRSALERYAMHKGIMVITPGLMAEMRKKAGR